MAENGRRQGFLPFVFAAAPRAMDLTAQAGLTLVAETMLALGLDDVVQDHLRVRRRRRGLSEFDKVAAVVLLQTAGGDRVEDVRVLRGDEGLRRLLGAEIPSPDGLHRFLRLFHDAEQVGRRPPGGAWIPPESAGLQMLDEVQREVVRRSTLLGRPRLATLDLDATILESHKREALAHYKGGRGYQPTIVVWSEQDLVVADEYRDGNVPAGMGTLGVAQRALAALPACVKERRFRGDSACYDESLLKHLIREGMAFTISADMSRELRAVCCGRDVKWEPFEERASEVVDLADVEFIPGNWWKGAQPLRYVALRFSARQGRLFGDGSETKYLAVVSNRREMKKRALVRWHWQKAGTVEHTHNVTKNDLGGRLPPSGLFGANAAWYRLTMLTYNILTVLKREGLPERLLDARPKRLRYEMFTVPAEIREHGRQTTARLGAPPLTVKELIAARRRLLAFGEALRSRLGA